MIDAQFIKLRKVYMILKFIPQQFSLFFKLQIKLFNKFIWLQPKIEKKIQKMPIKAYEEYSTI
jgi:hypothetical protein